MEQRRTLRLGSAGVVQGELDLEEEAGKDQGRLMGALGALKTRYGKATGHMASTDTAGDRREWSMRQERRTPHYTTDWSQVPVARA